MCRRKNNRAKDERHRAAHNAAEEENGCRQNRECERFEKRVFFPQHCPQHAVGEHKHRVDDQVHGKGFVAPKAESGAGDVEHHKSHTAVAPDLLEHGSGFVLILIIKHFLAQYRAEDIRDEHRGSKRESEEVDVFHLFFFLLLLFLLYSIRQALSMNRKKHLQIASALSRLFYLPI